MSIILLLPLIVALLLAVIYLISFAGATPSWGKTAIKTGAIACLVPLALMFHMPGWIVIGLVLGAVGDFALSRPGQGAFLAGMIAFAVPIIDREGRFASALAFHAPKQRIGFEDARAHVPTLRDGALRIQDVLFSDGEEAD